jgi:hypothetical protein
VIFQLKLHIPVIWNPIIITGIILKNPVRTTIVGRIQNTENTNSYTVCTYPIIPKLLVLLTKIRGMFIIAPGMERREEDEDEQTLYANYRAKAEMRYLMVK